MCHDKILLLRECNPRNFRIPQRPKPLKSLEPTADLKACYTQCRKRAGLPNYFFFVVFFAAAFLAGAFLAAVFFAALFFGAACLVFSS
jgi:hypothetical protein